MGLGGALFWSGLVRNLKEQYPEKRIVFVYARTWEAIKARIPISDHQIYKHNPDIFVMIPRPFWKLLRVLFKRRFFLVVKMDHPDYHYCSGETSERIFFKTGKHAIQVSCDVHRISPAKLTPKIVLTHREVIHAQQILKSNQLQPKRYICVEPHIKTVSPNKAWFWERWQAVVDRLNVNIAENYSEVQIVQIGTKTNRTLNDVANLAGRSSFREVAEILREALFFVSYMGGLIHLSKAVGTRNVVLISSWEPKELASYPDDINLYTEIDCQNCGLKVPCPIERECMRRITVEMVVEACQTMLAEEYGKYA